MIEKKCGEVDDTQRAKDEETVVDEVRSRQPGTWWFLTITCILIEVVDP